MNPVYETEATAVGGREGRVRSIDGTLDVDLQMPKALGGRGGHATNPEQLFAAGYAACFESAVRHVARADRIRVGDLAVTAKVGLGPNDDGRFVLGVELHVSAPDLEPAAAERLVDKAHTEMCPYSHATRGNIDVRLFVEPIPAVS